jgi:CubicO group peptidase (beta-lactamase class C family)
MSSKDQRRPLPRSAPGQQGVSAAALLAFIEDADTGIRDLHSVMILRHGYVLAEGWWSPYGPRNPHMLFSLSKSFTSTAAGLLVAEGQLALDAPVISFFKDDLPAKVNEHLAAMRVRDLLTMTSGHTQDTLGTIFARQDGNWARGFLEQPVERKPGTHFVYNSGATYMVSAIVQKITGKKLLDYLQPRLFEPLGIEGATWESCPRGINTGGWGLSIKTEDIARFGQLYLQRGMWRGRRLLPESWVSAATARQVANGSAPESDWNQGYGYQFWRCRHGAYRGDGAFGQYCLVLPEQDMVVAITAGVGDMQAVLNVVWKHLLTATAPQPQPEDKALQQTLRRRLSQLALRPLQGQSASPRVASLSGRIYRLEPNDQKMEQVTFEFGEARSVLKIRTATGEHRIVCGRPGTWIRGTTRLEGDTARAVAASGAWTDENTYTAQLCFYETPFIQTMACRFEQDRVRIDSRANVSFGPRERPQLVGQAVHA